MIDTSIIISGSAGQGIQTVGYILAKTASKAGYNVFSWQEYESRIRGGSSSYRIRISDYPINAPFIKADILLSLDKKSNEKYLPLLKEDGIILDEHQIGKRIINVPFTGIAQQTFRNKLFANVVAVGALSAVIGIDPDTLNKVISSQFSSKGEEIVSKNIDAAAEGYRSARKSCEGKCSRILPKIEQQYYFISGNEALALGAAAAGCRFMAAYPMTPSTGIITYFLTLKDP